MAQVARSQIRAADTVGRWGGEEFFLLLPHTRLPKAQQLVERLRHEIMSVIVIGDRPVTVSFGLAEYCNDDLASLLARTDEALYTPDPPGAIECV